MLGNVFSKTLFEKRWMIVGWSVVIVAFTAMIVLLYPVISESFGQALNDVPDSLKSLMGDAKAYQTLNGYVDIQVFNQMIFMPVILGIILCTGLIAGKEEQGVLQSLLAQPVKRSQVYLQLLLASITIIAIASFAIFATTWICAMIISEPLNISRMLQATLATLLVTLVISTFGFALGAITGKRGFAGMLTGVIAFLSYTITALEPGVKALKYPNYLSPIKYFNTPSVMSNGLKLSNVLVMLVATLLLAVAGYIFFVKRDIYQK